MKLLQIAGDDCPDGRTCPAVHRSDRQTLVIVGSIVSDADTLAKLAIGPNETAVEVPFSLLPGVACA